MTLDLTKLGSGSWSANDKLTLSPATPVHWLEAGYSASAALPLPMAGCSPPGAPSQSWTLDYNDTVKGNNFAGDANGTYVTMTAVPEPTTLLLGGLGFRPCSAGVANADRSAGRTACALLFGILDDRVGA